MTCNCKECNIPLIVGKNITQYQFDHHHHICRDCWRKYMNDRNHKLKKHLPMDENHECSLFLGVTVAENVLSHVFKNVVRMPHGNRGYDFICNKGYKIDVKCTCVNYKEGGSGHMDFNIRKNVIADYFLCLVFDNRESLNALHIWLLPGDEFNHLACTTISNSTIHKWDQHKINKIDEIVSCCDTIRREK